LYKKSAFGKIKFRSPFTDFDFSGVLRPNRTALGYDLEPNAGKWVFNIQLLIAD
jgi:hypothetical protein